MSIKHKRSGFERTNWIDKTTKQKQKAIEKHFNNLGLKVPQYAKQNTLSNLQLNKALNRITKEYDKQIEKYDLQKSSKGLTFKSALNKFRKTIDKYNSRIDKIDNEIVNNYGLSDIEMSYLRGEQVTLKIRKKSFFKNDLTLEKEDFENFRFTNTKAIVKTTKMINDRYKKLNTDDIMKSVGNSKKHDMFFKSFLDEKFMQGADEQSKIYIFNEFNKLNALQKDMLIKAELNDLREEYKSKNENNGEFNDDSMWVNPYNRTLTAIRSVYKETTGKSLI